MVGWFFPPRLGFLDRHSCTIPIPLFSLHSVSFGASLFLFSHSSTPELAESGMPHGASGNCHAATGLGGFLSGWHHSFCLPFLSRVMGRSIVTGGRAGRVWGMASKTIPRLLLACSVCLCLFAGAGWSSSGAVCLVWSGDLSACRPAAPTQPLVTGVGRGRRRSKWGFRMTDKSFSWSCLGFGESAGWVGFGLG